MIPEETIARIRESVNIADLIRDHLPQLKKRGRNYQACCPFHQEKTPSFHVNPEMGIFKCFGCGAGGDAFKYLMLSEGLSYPEAIRKLAQRVGIAVEEARGEAVSADERRRQSLYALLDDAARFYHRHLVESAEAQPARDYLAKRGLSAETLTKFQIGFAPASGHALRDAASRKGWDIDVLESAGLLRHQEGSGRIHDHFWNRIIFPIWDVQGRVVAFGGRAMGDALPKYINSPETPIYTKSRHLYGLFQGLSALRKSRRGVILEGYMDVVVCQQFGFQEAVATLGTALTDDHVRMLRRYAERITLLFDPDAAGAQAALRGGEMLITEGFIVDVVTLPDNVDADEVLVRQGKEALDGYFQKAVPFMEYCLAQSLRRHPLQRPEDKLAVAQDLLPVIRQVRDPLLQDEHLLRLAEALRVEKSILAQEMKIAKKGSDSASGKQKAAPLSREALPNALLSLEEEMLLLSLLHPSSEVAEMLAGFTWQDDRCRQAWAVLGTPIAEGALHLGEAARGLPEELQAWFARLAMQSRSYKAPVDALKDYLRASARQQEAFHLRDLQQEINSMIEGRIPMDTQKVQIYNDLSRRLKGSLN